MRAEIESKLAAKYEKKVREMERLFEERLAQERRNFLKKLRMGMQQSCDGAVMAAEDVFDCTQEQAVEFIAQHMENVNKMSHMAVVEDKDDPDMWWTKDTIDRRIRKIVGEENFQPWDQRYDYEEETE